LSAFCPASTWSVAVDTPALAGGEENNICITDPLLAELRKTLGDKLGGTGEHAGSTLSNSF
jgi:hypothetical protein